MRKRNMAKRSFAALLSAVMVMTAVVPSVFAEEVPAEENVMVEDTEPMTVGLGSDEFFEDDSIVVEDFAEVPDEITEEVIADEQADLSADELFEAAEGDASEDELFVTEADEVMDEATEELPGIVLGQQGTPAKVTGVVIEPKDDDWHADMLRWNAVDYVWRYEIQVSDADGVVYGHLHEDVSPDRVTWHSEETPKTPDCYVMDLSGEQGYTADGEEAKDGEKFKYSLEAGKTYSVRVRAVFKNTPDEGDVTYGVGEWSDPVTYTVAAEKVPQAITGFAFVELKDDVAYFTMNEVLTDGSVWYQVASDSSFDPEKIVSNGNWYDDEDKLVIYTDDLEAGHYFVRALHRVNGKILNAAGTAVKAYYGWQDGKWYDEEGNEVEVTYATAEFDVSEKEITMAPEVTGFGFLGESTDSLIFACDPPASEIDLDIYLEVANNDEGEFVTQGTFGWDYNLGKYVARYNKSGITESGKKYYFRAVAHVANGSNDENPWGTPTTAVEITKKDPVAISGLDVSRTTSGTYQFTFANGEYVNGSRVEIWLSSDANFANRREKSSNVTRVYYFGKDNIYQYYNDYNGYKDIDFNNRSFSIGSGEIDPGKIYYVKVRTVVNPQYMVNGEVNRQYYDNSDFAETYSEFSNTVSFMEALSKPGLHTRAVTNSSITLVMDGKYGNTGYELQRKNGKKWVTLTRTTDNVYVDKGLSKDVTYKYRARIYYYDNDTKAYVAGDWTKTSATTWGSALKLQAEPTGRTTVKLTWKKVKGAQGYEVWVGDTYSDASKVQDSVSNSYSKMRLVKTLGKGKKSYTVKKLTPDRSYEFAVRAFKTVKGKKYYIDDWASVSLGFGRLYVTSILQPDGSLKLKWTPMVGAKGYLVESQNAVTGQWETFADLTSWKKDSITLKADGTKDIRYRIRAYHNVGATKEFSNASEYTVEARLNVVTGVTATVQADGSVMVSWKPVEGASYYEVYRSTEGGADVLNVNLNGVYGGYYDGEEQGGALPVFVGDSTSKYGYRASSDKLTGTAYTDRKIAYTDADGFEYVLWEGPEEGVTYYYYVVAFAYIGGATEENPYAGTTVSSAVSVPAKAQVTTTAVAKTQVKKATAAAKKVTVKWKKVAGATGYEVFRSTSKKSIGMKIGDVTGGSKTSFVDKTANAGTTYYYTVKAVKYDESYAYVSSSKSNNKKVKAK